MLHEPANAPSAPDHAIAYKVRLGVILFFAYALVYVGFIAISLYDVTLMDKTVLLGLNLAVVYGFGLIVIALVLALVYNAMCSAQEKKLNIKPAEAAATAAESQKVDAADQPSESNGGEQ